ncbi:MAG: tRNA (guanosine-2'-O-)-methyltransferase [Alphaproteobacteria bacterium]|jgi:tRNA (guanosine-2'-O-)-methyltransferase
MTMQRYHKIRALLSKRQPDLTLLLEEVHKPHNVSAIIRSADAVGVHRIHAVWEENTPLLRGTAMGSQVWVDMHRHSSTEKAIKHLKSENMQVLVTNLDDTAVDFREIDYTKPTAIVLGQEKSGATVDAIAMSDHSIVIPMLGMVQSLNVSVAAALILYEAQRQRDIAGMYEQNRLSEAEAQLILFEGGFPVLHAVCIKRKLPFPLVNDRGEIVASDEWWQSLQFSEK